MATGVQRWSKTAGLNSTADTQVNWQEGQAPSSINDSSRAEMSSVAKWRDDISGTLTTGGSSTAYTITTNQSFTADAAGMSGAMLCFIPHATSGLNPTLAVDGLTARAINQSTGVAVPTGALILGTPYVVTYVNATTEFILQGMLGAATFNDPVQILSTVAGAASAPSFDLFRNKAASANDQLGNVAFNAQNSAAAKTLYSRIVGQILVATAAAETGALLFQQRIAGAFTTVLQSTATAWTTALIFSLTNVTNALSLAGGTTGQRNGSPTAGDTRYNTTLNGLEYWNGTVWVVLGQAPTVQTLTTAGAGTYTPNTGMVRIRGRICGGGSGGGGSTANNGNAGTATVFADWTANPGSVGGGNGGAGGAGGTGGTVGTGTQIARLSGGSGNGSGSTVVANVSLPGGLGGSNPFGGAGAGGQNGAGGTNAAANTGAGGGGAGGTSASNSGAGGGSGEYVEFYMTAAQVGASKTYTVGAKGTGGAAGGRAGGDGAAGIIIIEEFYA